MEKRNKLLLAFLRMYVSEEKQDFHLSEIDWKKVMTLIIDCLQNHVTIYPDNSLSPIL